MSSLISIIVVSYKNEEFIYETLDSILNQDYHSIELVIADDGTKGFIPKVYIDYINSKKKDNIKNIKVYSNKRNLGSVKNINNALKVVSGKYIRLIASDDAFYSSNTISECIKIMIEKKSILLATEVELCNEKLEKVIESDHMMNNYKHNLAYDYKDGELFKKLAIGNWIYSTGIFFTKDFFDKYGYFDEKYVLMEDWPMWLRLARDNFKIDYCDIVSVKYRMGVGVSSKNKINPLLENDIIKCYEEDILPYKKYLGNWVYRQARWKYIKHYKFKDMNSINKLISIITSMDVIIITKIERNLEVDNKQLMQ